jgi:hypothetical protein
MKGTELFTLIISAIALIASFVSIYFQFFHRKTAILGKLLSINYEVPNEDFDQELNYSLSNLGNQEVLLNDVEFLEGNSSRGLAHDGYTLHKYKCLDSPYVLKPGEIKLIKVYTKLKKTKHHSNSGNKFFIAFAFTSLEGKSLEILHDITKQHSNDPKEENPTWKPFTLKDATDE